MKFPKFVTRYLLSMNEIEVKNENLITLTIILDLFYGVK